MIHRSQQKNPQVSYTYTGKRTLPKASAAQSFPTRGTERSFSETPEKLNSFKELDLPWGQQASTEVSGKSHTARTPRSELKEKLKAPPRKPNKGFRRALAANSTGESKGLPGFFQLIRVCISLQSGKQPHYHMTNWKSKTQPENTKNPKSWRDYLLFQTSLQFVKI